MTEPLALPTGAQEIKPLALPTGARAMPENVDKKTGANWKARMAVGGINMRDKLATAKQYYPDAQMYGEDNIVFTHPETGNPTLLNPPGLDFGDIPGVGREGAEMVGSGLGVAVAAATTPLTAGTSLLAIPTAAGLGGSTGGALYDAAMQYIGGVPDSRGVGQRAIDTGVDFLANATGQRVGDLVNLGTKKLIGVGKDTLARATASRVADAAEIGVDLPAGAASGSNVIQSAEHALSASPGGGSVMQESLEKTLRQFDDAAHNVATKFGSAPAKEEAGSVVVSGAKAATKRYTDRQEVLYDKAYDLVGRDTPVFINSTQKLLETMKAELKAAPESLDEHISGSVKALERIVNDSLNGNGIPFSAWRQIRTAIGKNLKNPLSSGATSAQNTSNKRIYKALSEDMDLTARTGGDLSEAAQKALKTADRYTRFNESTNIPFLKNIAKYEKEAERALTYAMSGAKDGGSRLARLRRNLNPEEWDEVASHVLANMGRGADGGSFSVAKFVTAMTDKLSPGASNALFSGSRYNAVAPLVRRLVDTGKALKRSEGMANQSGTGRALAYMSLMGVFGGSGYAGGDKTGAAVGLASSILAPRTAAKLITSPKFLRWLSTSVTKAANPQGITTQLTKLVAIGKGTPEIQEEIYQYIAAVQEQK